MIPQRQILPQGRRRVWITQGPAWAPTLKCAALQPRSLWIMRIGVPKEIKVHEYRVGLVPAGVRELVGSGHEVGVEAGAGCGIGVEDTHYTAAGATIAKTAAEVFERADLVVKVKEPQPAECEMLRPSQVLFTYLHLAADPVQAKGLMKSGATAIAYET